MGEVAGAETRYRRRGGTWAEGRAARTGWRGTRPTRRAIDTSHAPHAARGPGLPRRRRRRARGVGGARATSCPTTSCVFTDVGLQDGATEREIDLLVAWPGVGLAVIEVKGGHVTRRDGQWWQGSGDAAHPIDPVHQVQDARHVLTDLLRQHGLEAARARIAHLVALPHTPVPRTLDAPDLPARDARRPRRPRARRGPREAGDRRTTAPVTPRCDAGALEALVDLPDGQRSRRRSTCSRTPPSTRTTSTSSPATRRACSTRLRTFRRLQVVGGAGTGKTWLALEQARRLRQGRRTRRAALLLARARPRTSQRVTQTWRPQRATGVRRRCSTTSADRWGAPAGCDDDSDYWERRLPAQMGSPRGVAAAGRAVRHRRRRRGAGLRRRVVAVAAALPARPRARAGSTSSSTRRSGCSPATASRRSTSPPIVLDENLRNTKQIAQLCGSLRDGMTRPRGWDGSPVRIVDVPADDAIGAADDVVDALLEEGWEPGHDRPARHRLAGTRCRSSCSGAGHDAVLGRLLRRRGRLLRARPRVQGPGADRRGPRRQRLP